MAAHSIFTAHEPLPRLQGWKDGAWATWIALFFDILSLIALVLVPWLLDRRTEDVRRQIVGVLQPARDLATDLEVAQIRELGALRDFMFTGQSRFRDEYRQARAREEDVYEQLYALTEGIQDLSVRERLVAFWSLSLQSRVDYETLLAGGMTRTQLLDRYAEEQALFERIQAAAADIRRSITELERRERQRLEAVRDVRFWGSIFLLVLALAATLVLGFFGVRLRNLIKESERRRHGAVRSRREVDALLAATGDGVFAVDHDGRCTFVNAAGLDLLGCTSRELLGRHLHELILHSRPDGTPYEAEETPWARALAERATVRVANERLWRKDGSTFPVKMTARPLVDGRVIQGVVLTLTDMTEAQKAQTALREAIKARDEVLAVVSHDLRNPVGAIFFSADLLLKVPLDAADATEQLEVIRRSAARMNRLISDLLDVAQMEAGGLQIEMGREEMAPLLDEAVSAARPLAEQKGLDLTADIEPGMGMVLMDWDRMLQVLSNLIGNAIKFTDEGGHIRLQAWQAGEEAVVAVADTGRGIHPEDRRHLFDRFWQVQRSDRDGAGLGLAIVKRVVEAHGGRVWVESEPERGSTFFFSLRTATASDPDRRSERGDLDEDREDREAEEAARISH